MGRGKTNDDGMWLKLTMLGCYDPRKMDRKDYGEIKNKRERK